MNKKLLFGIVFVLIVAAALIPFGRSANWYATPVVQLQPVIAAHVVNDSSVVGYWRFEKPSNATFTNDYLGRSNGTVNISIWTEQGKIGGSYLFNGTNGSDVDLITNSTINISSSSGFSVEAWVKPNSLATTTYANSQSFVLDRTTLTNGIIQLYQTGGNITFRIRGDDNAGLTLITDNSLSSTNWFHVVGVRYKSPSNITIYVNGVMKNSTADLTTGNFTGFNYRVGNAQLGGSPWNGSIDELVIYNRSLSAQEIQNHYQEGSASRLLKSADLGVSLVNASNYSRVVYDWRENNISLAVVNLPFIPDHVPLADQVLYMPFENESNSSQAFDLSGSGNNGTVTSGAIFNQTAGVIGSAYTFNGVNQYLNITSSPSINFELVQNFTVSAWIKTATNSRDANFAGIIAKGNSSAAWVGYQLLLWNNSIGFEIQNSTSNKLSIAQTSAQLNDSNWHYLVAMVNRSPSNTVYLYVDNILQSETASSIVASNITSNADMLIGVERTPLIFFNGTIDEVMIWNRTLTAAELTANYNKGTTIRDFSTLGNNATFTNSSRNNPFFNASGGPFPGWGAYMFLGAGGVGPSYINITNNSGLSISTGRTITAWINARAFTNYAGIVAKGDDCGTVCTQYELSHNQTGFLLIQLPSAALMFGTTKMSVNTWYFVASTYNGSAVGTNVTIWINGAQDASNITVAGQTFAGNNRNLHIGGYVDGSQAFYFNGSISNVKIYNRTLSGAEILSEYQQAYNTLKSNETNYRNNYSVAVTVGNDYSLNDTLSTPNLQVKPLQSPNFFTNVTASTPYLAAHVVNDSSVLAYWRFEKPSNNTFTNDFVNTQNGTVTQANWTEQGKVGSAYTFNGATGYIDLGDNVTIQPNTSFSLEAWFNAKVCTNSGVGCEIYRKRTFGFTLGLRSSGAVQFGFTNVSVISTTANTSTTINYSDGNWHHAVGIYALYADGTNRTLLYVDGNLTDNQSSLGAMAYGPGSASIGRDGNANGNYFNGTIDEVILWNRSLSSTEVLNHFQAGNATRVRKLNDLGAAVVNASNYTSVVYDWRIANTSIAVLNLPFEPDHLPIDPSAVLYMPFENESNSTRANDLTSFGNNGTVYNTIYNATGGMIGGAYQFNGTQGVYINVTTIIGNTTQQNITIEAWIKPFGTGNQQIVSKGTGTGTAVRSYGLYINLATGLGFEIVNSTGYDVDSLKGGTNLTAGNWNHVAATYNGTLMTWYINGVSVGTNTTQFGDINVSSNPLIIGEFNAVNSPFNGSIDELVIYNRSLSSTEITAHYNWGKNVRDFSTYGNNATLSGASSDPFFNASGGPFPGWGAYVFNGVSNYINSTSTALPNTGGGANITISAWINPNALTSSIVNNVFMKGANANCINYGMAVTNNSIFGRNSNSDFKLGGGLATGSWQYVAVSYNTSGMFGYVNGVLVGNNSALTTACAATNWTIGARAGGGAAEFFNGSISNLKVYNRSLSADEILSEYQQAYSNLKSPETAKWQNYTAAVTLGNDYSLNDTLVSDNLQKQNTPPYWTSLPIINSTYGYNGSHENITCTGTGVDDDGDAIITLADFRKQNSTPANVSDMVLYMPFDGGNSTFTQDFSTFGNNGTVTNQTNYTLQGKVGGAYVFNAINSVVNITTTPSLNLSQNFTIATWVNLNSLNLREDIVAKWSSSNQNYLLTFNVASSNKFEFYHGTSCAIGGTSAKSTSAITAGTWYFLVGSFNGTQLSLYKDGVLEGTFANTNAFSCTNKLVHIGGNPSEASNEYFNGTIDEVRIWNRTLSANEILNLNSTTGPNRFVKESFSRGDNISCVATPSDNESLGLNDGTPSTYANTSAILKPILGCVQVNSTDSMEGDIYSPGSTCFNLTVPNITFNGAGFKLFGNTAAFGIRVNSTNVTVTNILVENFSTGIVLNNAHNSTILNSTMRFNNNSQIWIQNTTDALLQYLGTNPLNLTGGTIGLFLDNSSFTKIYGVSFNSSQIAVQLVGGINNTFINGTANGINNLTLSASSGSTDTLIYNFTQTINPPRQFNLTTGSNLTITNTTVLESNISTDSNSFMWIRWYLNVSVYASNQTTTPIGPATLNVTSEDPRILYNLGPNNSTEIMVRESIFNFSTTQLNFTTNITANSSLGYQNNFTEALVLSSRNLTITLSNIVVQSAGGGGGSGSVAAGTGIVCDLPNGYFLLNNSCILCPGTFYSKNITNSTNQTQVQYFCKACDGMHYYNESTNKCDPLILSSQIAQSPATLLSNKFSANSAKYILALVGIALVFGIFYLNKKSRKKSQRRLEDDDDEL